MVETCFLGLVDAQMCEKGAACSSAMREAGGGPFPLDKNFAFSKKEEFVVLHDDARYGHTLDV